MTFISSNLSNVARPQTSMNLANTVDFSNNQSARMGFVLSEKCPEAVRSLITKETAFSASMREAFGDPAKFEESESLAATQLADLTQRMASTLVNTGTKLQGDQLHEQASRLSVNSASIQALLPLRDLPASEFVDNQVPAGLNDAIHGLQYGMKNILDNV